MEYGKKSNCLIFGFDDSNHSGNFGEEYIVSVVSKLYEDSMPEAFKNRRNLSLVQKLMDNPDRDYVFTRLNHEFASRNKYNLPLVAPLIAENFIRGLSEEEKPEKIFLYFDGPIKAWWENILENDFERFDIEIDCFTGNKKLHCPKVVYMADVISNDLYRKVKEGASLPLTRQVSLDEKSLFQRDSFFNN